MIAKDRKSKEARRAEPLDVSLTVRFNYGADPQDTVTVIDDRRIPMVGSVFANRDRIIRSFVSLLLRTGLREPRMARRVLGLNNRGKRK